MIVVTGAAGFIGANLALKLLESPSTELLAVDHEAENCARYLGDESERVCFVRADRLPEWLASQAERVEAILHLGACSETTARDRAYMLANNTEYTRTLFKWCAAHAKPFVYASSASTYGDGAQGFDDEADPRQLKPMHLYGESKHLFDLWALEQRITPPRWAGLKFFNVYGPREGHKGRMASMVLHTFKQIQATGQVKLFKSERKDFEDGGQKRDFVYVDDAVAAVLHFLRAPVTKDAPNGLYNVGTGQARTFKALAEATFAALGRAPNIEYIPMPEDLRAQYQYFTCAAAAKRARAGLAGPFVTLEEGVRRYVTGFLAGRPEVRA